MPKVVGGNRVERPSWPAPKMSVVPMDAVPDPPCGGKRAKYNPLWEQIQKLKEGAAVKVVFESEKQAHYVRARMREKAKEIKRFLSSSHETDGMTWYFWLETR